MACSGEYTVTRIPPSPQCITTCQGVSLSATVTVDETEDGCTFDYNVTGGPGSSGTVNLNCPGSQTLIFQCDSGGLCDALKIVFKCNPEGTGGFGA